MNDDPSEAQSWDLCDQSPTLYPCASPLYKDSLRYSTIYLPLVTAGDVTSVCKLSMCKNQAHNLKYLSLNLLMCIHKHSAKVNDKWFQISDQPNIDAFIRIFHFYSVI